MKWTLLVILYGIVVFNSNGQGYSGKAISNAPVNIPSDAINKVFIAPPASSRMFKSADAGQSKMTVTYINFPDAAKEAFEYAVAVWERYITTEVPINIRAEWKPIDRNVLALTRPGAFYENFKGALVEDTYYPVALAEKLAGKDLNPGYPDIICTFNQKYPWHFGTDGQTPSTKYDFVSAVLHELTHGLGFSGFLEDMENNGYFNSENNDPSIYDYYIYNHLNQQIADESLFSSPSYELHQQLTSGNLKAYSPEACGNESSALGNLYSPDVWKDGASIYHLNKTGSSGENRLMNYSLAKGAAYHRPEEATLKILSEIGWGAPSFQFQVLPDREEKCASIPIEMGIQDDAGSDDYRIKVIFSTDYFSSSDSVTLRFNETTQKFSGEMPVNFHLGRVQYYFTAKNPENRTYTFPAGAPSKKYSMRIGPDYFAPEIKHNPIKVISKNASSIRFSARVSDNLGVNSVKIKYKLNGILQEPLMLTNNQDGSYSGTLVPDVPLPGTHLEYCLVAEDKSSRKNQKSLPSGGFYSVEIFSPLEPMTGYYNDFESVSNDFSLAGFSISDVPGFPGKILNTLHPYPVSAVENQNNHLVAQLKYPVVLQENGKMSFDEIVLVEPGTEGAGFQDQLFWDYVIVEGSKDNGLTWHPLTEGYDSGKEEVWSQAFNNNMKSSTSECSAQANMFREHTLNLTAETVFEQGDTVIFRFRLASDYAVNGWGWAIDNLEIQDLNTASPELLAENDVKAYPNPFSDQFFVECSNQMNNSPLEIVVTDLSGKTIYRESGINPAFAQRTRVELPGHSKGFYFVTISKGNRKISTQKMIKN